jgi:hypothetical protein
LLPKSHFTPQKLTIVCPDDNPACRLGSQFDTKGYDFREYTGA